MDEEVTAARAAARLARQVEQVLAEVDLSVAQYRVLAVLAEESVAAGLVARRLAVRPPTLTSVIDGLVGRGLVDRRPDADDRRRQALCLTPAGARALTAGDDAVAGRLRALASRLDARRAERAVRALGDWQDALDRTIEDKLAVRR